MRVTNRARLPVWIAVLLGLWCVPAMALGQADAEWDPERLPATRDSLQTLMVSFDAAARSPAYSQELRSRARFEASRIRSRLQEGDFRVGDQVTLSVRGQTELSNTFVVEPGPRLMLPEIGEIPLQGILRSELETHLATHLSRFIREPVVRTTSTIRITVVGEVSQPGFMVVESGMLLTDVLQNAGGPTRGADLGRIQIERGQERIWGGDPLQDAIIEGRTLDQLSVRAGDRIVVPSQRQNTLSTWAWRLLTPSFTFYMIRRLF
jgi:protein involved in polysaccharide export with SLBB domain